MTQDVLDFIFHTAICPKGHAQYINQTQAAAKFFPDIQSLSAKLRVLNSALSLITQIFSGQIVDECQAEYDRTHAKYEPKGTKPRLSIEDKAEREVVKELKITFRKQENIKSTRGRLPGDLPEKLERYIEDHKADAIAKRIEELKEK